MNINYLNVYLQYIRIPPPFPLKQWGNTSPLSVPVVQLTRGEKQSLVLKPDPFHDFSSAPLSLLLYSYKAQIHN